MARGGSRPNSGRKRRCFCGECRNCYAVAYYHKHREKILARNAERRREKAQKPKFKVEKKYEWDRT